jgi:CRP-like cAMP-binding protein
MIPTQVLRHFPHFSGLSEEVLKKIARISREKTFTAGERLFSEENTATHFMLLKAGEVHIVYRIGDGSDVVADTLVMGDPMAWSALLEPHRLTASGIASKDGILIKIEAEGLRRLCKEDKEFGYVMMKEIAKTLRSRLSAMRVQSVSLLGEPV